jgi:hydroxymethylbilane synthase
MQARPPSPDTPFRIGTRGSPLALAQAHETRARLMAAHGLPESAFAITVIETTGDRVQDRPLGQIGGKGLFTKEIETALLDGTIDIAVHSMKDVPTVLPDGLALIAFLPREDVRDAFLSYGHDAIAALPSGAVVGTSSLRRRAQLLHRRPDLTIVEFRGNVQTRLRKLRDGVAGATFLAMAGLRRLGLADLPATPVEPGDMLPAVAQGAIGIEARAGDGVSAALLSAIADAATAVRLSCERAFLAGLDGSCQTPIAGLALLDDDRIAFRGQIVRPDGSESLDCALDGPAGDAARIGAEAAAALRGRAGPGFLGPGIL